jgi:hypothetical protein
MSATIEAVYVHGFRNYDGGSEYCDPDENPDGWCVYERTVTTEGGEFDHGEEADFPTFAAAMEYAEQLANRHGCELQCY